MATLDLDNQGTSRDEIEPKIQQLKTELNKRKELWDKIAINKKVAWIKSDKDPIMTLAWQAFKYLRNNFFSDEVEIDHG